MSNGGSSETREGWGRERNGAGYADSPLKVLVPPLGRLKNKMSEGHREGWKKGKEEKGSNVSAHL